MRYIDIVRNDLSTFRPNVQQFLSHYSLVCLFVSFLRVTPRSLTLRDVSIQKQSSRIIQLSITQNDIILQDTNLWLPPL